MGYSFCGLAHTESEQLRLVCSFYNLLLLDAYAFDSSGSEKTLHT